MKTVKLKDIVRQKDPELKQVVEHLARGEMPQAIQNLDQQGRVHEIQGYDERIAAIAKEYAKSPENTLVVSPDDRSRREINDRVHAELQRSGIVSNEEHTSKLWSLVRTSPPQTAPGSRDTRWAKFCATPARRRRSIGKGEYAQVKSIDAPEEPADSRAAGRYELVIEHILPSLSASRDRQAIRLTTRHRGLASVVGLLNLKLNEILAFRVA